MARKLLLIILTLILCGQTAYTQWLCPWENRMEVTVQENSGNNLTNYQLRIDVTFLAGMNSDFSDLRFTTADGTTQIDYWIERYTASTSAIVWVEIPSLPANAQTDIYLYYCNPATGLSTTSNGPNTFVFFDDFTDWQGWSTYGSGVVQADGTTIPGTNLLAKVTQCDPNGGYKVMNSTLSQFRMISREIRLTEGGTSCSWNRYGLENGSYNGYTIRRNADSNQNNQRFGYERRNGGSASNTNDTNLNHPRDIWYRTELRRCSNTSNNLSALLYDDNRNLIGQRVGTDNQYNSFDRVTIRGGRPYYFDFIAVGNFTCSEPTFTMGTVEKDLPTAICQNITAQLGADGQVQITTAEVDNGSYDACGIDALSLDKSKFGCDDKGNNLVTLTVTDLHGNTATCTAIVLVVDAITPAISCPANIVVNASASNCSAVVTWATPTATDNCTVSSLTPSHNSGNTFPEGTTIVQYTATDDSGNTSTCTFSVTVNNNLPAPNITISESSGQTDNDGFLCSGDEATLTANAGYDQYDWSTGSSGPSITTSAAGSYTVTVSDTNGCTNTASTTINLYNILNGGTCNLVHDLCQNNSGQVTVEASGGLAPYLISWTPNVGNASTTTILASGGQITIEDIPGGSTLNITITDSNGCIKN